MSRRAKRGPKLTPADYVADLEFSGPGQRRLAAPRERLEPQPLRAETLEVLAPQATHSSPSVARAPRSLRRPQLRERLSASTTLEAQRRQSEASRLPSRLLTALPAALTLLCEACVLEGTSAAFVVTTSQASYAEAQRRRLVTLHGVEWAAVALAAARGRVWPAYFEDWLAHKQRDPSWELTASQTLGCWVSGHDERELTVRGVLEACGARLVDVSDAAVASSDFWQEITQ